MKEERKAGRREAGGEEPAVRTNSQSKFLPTDFRISFRTVLLVLSLADLPYIVESRQAGGQWQDAGAS